MSRRLETCDKTGASVFRPPKVPWTYTPAPRPNGIRAGHTATYRRGFHASVRLLHVSRPPFDSKLSLGGVSERGREEYRRSAAMQAMVSLGAFAERANLGRALLEVRLGSADAVLRERAEQVGRTYDVVLSRALAPLDRLIRWCLPLTKPRGQILAIKGASAGQELIDHDRLITASGLIADVVTPRLGDELEATTVVRLRLA